MKIPLLEIGLLWFFIFWLYKTYAFWSEVSGKASKSAAENDPLTSSMKTIQIDIGENSKCPNLLKSRERPPPEVMVEKEAEYKTSPGLPPEYTTQYGPSPEPIKKKNQEIKANGDGNLLKRGKKTVPVRKIGRRFGENAEINILFSEIRTGIEISGGDKIRAIDHVLEFLERNHSIGKLEDHKFYYEFFKACFISSYKIFPCYKKISGDKLKLKEVWEMLDPNMDKLYEKNVTTESNEFLNYYFEAADHFMNFMIDGNNITELKFDQVFQFWQLLYSYYWPLMFQAFENSTKDPMMRYANDASKFIKEWKKSENRTECHAFATFFEKGVVLSQKNILAGNFNDTRSSYEAMTKTFSEWNEGSKKEHSKIWSEENKKKEFLISEKMFRLANGAWLYLGDNWRFHEHHVDSAVVEGFFDLILEKTVDVSLSREKTKDFIKEIRSFFEKKEKISKPVKIDRLDWIVIFQYAIDHLYKTYE